MSVRDTSKEAFASIGGELTERQAAVLAVLERGKALTNSELAHELAWPINTVTPRTHELRSLGRVYEAGKRKCRVTGRRAYQWAAGTKPVAPPPPKVEVVMVDGRPVARVVQDLPADWALQRHIKPSEG